MQQGQSHVYVEHTPPTSSNDNSPGVVATGLAEAAGFRRPLLGGVYDPQDALTVLNSHFFVGKTEQEVAVFRANADGTASFLKPEQFKLEIQNIFVRASSGKLVSGEKFWKEHPERNQKIIVFKPDCPAEPCEYNLWRGFGVLPEQGWQKQRRLMRHIYEVICRRDKEKFKYLMRYLAWAVQNPEKHSEVLIVLKSRKQGTGKSTLGKVMLDLFGKHGALVDDKERLLGRFTDWIEHTSFVLAEEILWAGDHKSADKLKSIITGETIQVEGKYRACRQVRNRLKIIATTNHDHAVASGVRDRRNVVYDVSEERVGDKPWFDALYHDLDDGGTGQFLNLLLNVPLGSWHPRQILKTRESVEQERMSGDTVAQWAQACIEADAVVGGQLHNELGKPISAQLLREAYQGFCRQNGQRPLGTEAFGKACTEMFGPRRRLAALQTNLGAGNKRRPWGYPVPTGSKWQKKLDARLGVETGRTR